MAKKGPPRRGEEAVEEKNFEDDFAEHGDPRQTRRHMLQHEIFKDKMFDEDGNADTVDDMGYARKELSDMIADGDADQLLSTTSTDRTTASTASSGRTTDTTRSAGGSPDVDDTEIEDLSDHE